MVLLLLFTGMNPRFVMGEFSVALYLPWSIFCEPGAEAEEEVVAVGVISKWGLGCQKLTGSWKPGLEESMEPPIMGPGCMSDLVGLRAWWWWEGECLKDSGVVEWQALWGWGHGSHDWGGGYSQRVEWKFVGDECHDMLGPEVCPEWYADGVFVWCPGRQKPQSVCARNSMQ